jgi:hypothetical protein
MKLLGYLLVFILLAPLLWITFKHSTREKYNVAAVMSKRCWMTAQEIRHAYIGTFKKDIEIKCVELCLKELIYAEMVEEKVLLPFSDLTPGYKLKSKDGVSNTLTPIPTQGCYA